MYDLSRFTQDDMYDCAIALRGMDLGARSMEEVANRMVRHLYHYLIDPQTGEPACALVRFFKTHPYGELNQDLQEAARTILKGRPVSLKTKCLTLLATVGDNPQWNARSSSTGHQAIPLLDLEFIYRAPMILQLIKQFGLEVNTVIEPETSLIMDLQRTTFNVFYVPEALGSDHIPAQQEFVIPYRIGSVLGFGGILPSGNLFAIILFSKMLIPPETADLFKWISAYVRIAVSSFDNRMVFARQPLLRA